MTVHGVNTDMTAEQVGEVIERRQRVLLRSIAIRHRRKAELDAQLRDLHAALVNVREDALAAWVDDMDDEELAS